MIVPSGILIAPPPKAVQKQPAARKIRREMDWTGNAGGCKSRVPARSRSLPAVFGWKASNERDKRNARDRERRSGSSENCGRERGFPFPQAGNRAQTPHRRIRNEPEAWSSR